VKTVIVGVVVDLLGRLVGLLERKVNDGNTTPITHAELEDLERKAKALRDLRKTN
jgi:tRNA(Arg) A34 adenosine deaminase TadA